MKLTKTVLVFLLVIAFAFLFNACSKGKSPIEPAMNDEQVISQDLPDSFEAQCDNRTTLAAYEAVIDPAAKTFTVTPISRSSQYHFPLTQIYPGVLQITDINWDPLNFWVEIKLQHPFPGSGIDGFDPRVIAILPAYAGVSMNYPIFNVHANNSIILEPDGYTKLFDSVNPSIVGNTNPFVAYFKNEPNRVWSSTGTTNETNRWYMDVTGIGGPFVFELVVDVSTNYPTAPQPIIDNAQEPAGVNAHIGTPLMPNGGSTIIEVTFLDWQGPSDIKCKVESPDLFNGAIRLLYYGPGSNPDEYVFSGTIPNELHASEGEYSVLIAAWDILTGTHVFKEATAVVIDEIIFDPSTVITLDTWGAETDVDVVGGYAYITNWNDGFQIADVDPPESTNIIKTVAIPGYPKRLFVIGGYAYVVSQHYGFLIIDISQPQDAHIVKTVLGLDVLAQDVIVTDGYAYVADGEAGLTIIDVDPVQSAYIVNTVPIDDYDAANDVAINGGYAYIASFSGLHIVDIDPVESAYIVKSVETPGFAFSIHAIDSYVFITDTNPWEEEYKLHVIYVDPPENASIVKSLLISFSTNDIFITGGYAYLSGGSGIHILDITPPENVYHVLSIGGGSIAQSVDVIGDLAYIADGWSMNGGLTIIDLW